MMLRQIYLDFAADTQKSKTVGLLMLWAVFSNHVAGCVLRCIRVADAKNIHFCSKKTFD